ncbi:vacuolar fusion protein ccz1, partial [Characodon lateralis]|nr:vacuolar fusion protein ccz1 [Characodon lateralis]
DTVYGAVVRQCYSMYKLFNGTFGRAMEASGVELLIQKLEKFFYRYLQTLHLQSCDLLDVFGGISFFPLDKMTYLKIQSFVNRVEESLSLIKYTAFLYNDQLIWYTLLNLCTLVLLIHSLSKLPTPTALKQHSTYLQLLAVVES